MADQPAIEILLSDSRKLRDMFQDMIEAHRQPLWRYCMRLTGSPWDAEDLFQETLMKAFATLPQLWNPFAPKSYLFRIATNSWIDSCRKRHVALDVLEEGSIADQEMSDPLEIREAIEILIHQLPPRQMVIPLLMDVFQFSANDVSNIVHCTPGAAYATLRRARQRLRTTQASSHDIEVARQAREPKEVLAAHEVAERVVHALNTGDIDEFMGAMSEHIHNDAAPGFQEFSKQEVRKLSGQGLPSGLHAAFYELWGREVIVVLADTDDGPALHNIAWPVVEDGALTYLRGYYFCKELLSEVAQRLGVPIQVDKLPENWDRL